jgi:hypothetical protein
LTLNAVLGKQRNSYLTSFSIQRRKERGRILNNITVTVPIPEDEIKVRKTKLNGQKPT